MDIALAVTVFCSIFSAPDFYLSKNRQKTACSSMQQVFKDSKKSNISPTLLMSMIFVESGWKKTAVSKANACGLTQVLPRYTGKITKKFTCDQLKDPKVSIMVGARTLRWWIDYHKNSLTEKQKAEMSPGGFKKYYITRGLCGYNAGFRCNGKKPNSNGIRYANKVLRLKKRLENTASSFIE